MYVVLPLHSGSINLKRMKSKLTPIIIENLIRNMTEKLGVVGFPRMKISSSTELQSAFKSLGFKSLFDPQTANLGVMISGPSAIPNLGSKKISDSKLKSEEPEIQEFFDFISLQNLTSLGIDDLRNNKEIDNPGIYADKVLHQVELTIDESGTEAAAVTSTILSRSGMSFSFISNRPFLFFIRQKSTKYIWFWGTIYKPTPFFNIS